MNGERLLTILGCEWGFGKGGLVGCRLLEVEVDLFLGLMLVPYRSQILFRGNRYTHISSIIDVRWPL